MSNQIYLSNAQRITQSGRFSFNNDQPKRGAAFINPKTNGAAVFVNGIPIPAGQTLSIDVHPGEVLANDKFDINLNGQTEIYATPLVYAV